MTWISAPDTACVHVACDPGPCQYQPPAIGPDLPACIIAIDGSVWSRHGGGSTLYYSPEPGGSQYGLIASRTEIVRAYAGQGAAVTARCFHFPVGEWRDGHQPGTPEQEAAYRDWQERIRAASSVSA